MSQIANGTGLFNSPKRRRLHLFVIVVGLRRVLRHLRSDFGEVVCQLICQSIGLSIGLGKPCFVELGSGRILSHIVSRELWLSVWFWFSSQIFIISAPDMSGLHSISAFRTCNHRQFLWPVGRQQIRRDIYTSWFPLYPSSAESF
jgi:hypothetical protein